MILPSDSDVIVPHSSYAELRDTESVSKFPDFEQDADVVLLKIKNFIYLQWGWGITGQKIMGQSSSDWLKMTSSRTSKRNSGGLSGIWTLKIGRKSSDKPVS